MNQDDLKKFTEDHKKWLNGEDGSRANLSEADLREADLSEADLSWADLSEADLSGADLSEADLREANLSGANLSKANLRRADLSWANLRWANLREANLSGADLSGANLSKANLSGADLSEADLRNAIGNMRELKSMQLEDFTVCYSKTDLAIGCQQHPIEDWWSLTDEQIEEMETYAGELWTKWKPLLMQIIEMSPAD